MPTAVRSSGARRLGRALLAPAFWLERARGRRQLALAALYLMVLAGAGLWIWRATSLDGLPDIGDPFDTRIFDQLSVSEADNAFAVYSRAIAKLSPPASQDSLRSSSFAWA